MKYLTQAKKLETILKYGSFRIVPEIELQKADAETLKYAEECKSDWKPEPRNPLLPTYEFKTFEEFEPLLGFDTVWQQSTNPFSLIDLVVATIKEG